MSKRCFCFALFCFPAPLGICFVFILLYFNDRHILQLEAERIMAQLESQSAREGAIEDDGSLKYMPSTDDRDPIVRALKTVLKCKEVTGEGKEGPTTKQTLIVGGEEIQL